MANHKILQMSTEVVCCLISNGRLNLEETLTALEKVSTHLQGMLAQDVPPAPAVSIAESYTDDYIICLEDGKHVTLLKRYLASHFDMTPEEYREKWHLPDNYPFVAKSYSKRRSQIAKDQGLGKSKD